MKYVPVVIKDVITVFEPKELRYFLRYVFIVTLLYLLKLSKFNPVDKYVFQNFPIIIMSFSKTNCA